MASNTPIKELLAEYEAEGCDFGNLDFIVTAAERYVQTMGDGQARCLLYSLAKVVREQIPEKIVKPIAVENPNVVDWRPLVKEGLANAVSALQTILGDHINITSSTHIRRSVMKDGGVKARLGLKFQASACYNRAIDPVKIIQRQINEVFTQNGLPFAAVLTTSGSQMNFSARVYLEGDEDYSTYVRIGRL